MKTGLLGAFHLFFRMRKTEKMIARIIAMAINLAIKNLSYRLGKPMSMTFSRCIPVQCSRS